MSALNAINIRQNGVITPFSKIGRTQRVDHKEDSECICPERMYATGQDMHTYNHWTKTYVSAVFLQVSMQRLMSQEPLKDFARTALLYNNKPSRRS